MSPFLGGIFVNESTWKWLLQVPSDLDKISFVNGLLLSWMLEIQDVELADAGEDELEDFGVGWMDLRNLREEELLYIH